jgi:pSer/pThr/pTyr-binding forkhead associated (FHA) protein
MALLKMKRDGKMVAVRLDREAVIVGSGPACNIKVPEGGLAPRHCQILRMNNGFVLRDLSGEVGTFINGKKVKEHLLSDRDVIQMGTERFTYAESEGENTARVAVSAAAPATARMTAAAPGTGKMTAASVPPPAAAKAPERATARVAVDPTRKTTTRAMPQAAPESAPASAGRGTGRMQKTGTQRLGAATTRRMPTGRTGRITTSTATFSMPKTRKGKVIAACVALGILGLGGVMTMVLLNQDNPKEIKAELDQRWKDSWKLKDTNPVKLDQEIDEIIANPKYRKYGAETYSAVKKSKAAVHQDAILQQSADKDVGPFLSKVKVAKADPKRLETDADNLYEETRSWLTRYRTTSYGPELTALEVELKAFLDKRASEKGNVPKLTLALGHDAMSKTKEGDCKGAAALVAEFGAKYNEKEDAVLFKALGEIRDQIKRGAEDFVKKKNIEAQKLVADGKKPDAVKLLEGCRAGLEGYPAALDKLEAALKALK